MEDLKQLAHTHPYWSLDEFAQVANQWLPRFLPEERANTRVREEVNPRLIRQYTTWGLIDPPTKEGREARYAYRHLLQLLVTRRLLAEGYATAVINKLMADQADESLETMLEGGAQAGSSIQSSVNPAIAFLQGLAGRSKPDSRPPVPSPRKAAPMPMAKRSAALARSTAPPPPPTPAPASAFVPAYPAEMESAKRAESYDSEFDLNDVEPYPDLLAACEEAAAPPLSPRRWIRVEVVSGLELHLTDDFRFPHSPDERQALLDLIAQQLDAATQAP
ncbi:MAG: MerR family transcriptional regulator [Candidatus Sericytochromatia bacterium]